MRSTDDLDGWTREFARTLDALLQGTVTNAAKVRAVLRGDRSLGWVGNKISERDPFPGDFVPLKFGKRKATGYLHFLYVLALDDEGEFLTVSSGHFGLYGRDNRESCLIRYEYDREPGNGYPPAHLHVHATSSAIEELPGLASRSLGLKDLHLPVGGRRFRPCMEDLIEFVVVEGIAEACERWEEVIEEHREEFQTRQLRAAVRRAPDEALAVLRRLGRI